MILFYCTADQVRVSSISVNFSWVLCPFWNVKYRKYTVFRFFLLRPLTYWAEILHLTLFYCTTDQVRLSSISVNFSWELCPFWNLEYWKYTVFCTFLLHALTYWAEILHMTLFYCTTDQDRVSPISVNLYRSHAPFELRILEIHTHVVFRTFLLHALTYWAKILHMILFYCTADQVWASSISVNFSWELCPFWNVKYWKYTVFRTFLLHPLTYWVEILHLTLFYCTTDQVRLSSISVNFSLGVMPLLECKLLKIHSFPHFSLTCFDILSWNFAFDFILLYYRSSLSVVNFCQFFLGVMPLLELRILEIHSFPLFSLTCFDISSWNFAWLCFTVLQIKFQCCQFPSIFVGVMPLLELRILKINSFPHFSLTRFNILSWNFAYDFV